MTGVLKHWEKIVLGAVLIVALVFILPSLTGGQAESELATAAEAKTITNAVADYAGTVEMARTPAPGELPRPVFKHPWLQYCTACRALQPLYASVCPECGATVTYSEDTDKDGMPNTWEQKFGLAWTDQADGAADPDRDRFSNLEEFKRESDPTNPASPNVILGEYRIAKVYRPYRPIFFKSKMGQTLSFNYRGKGQFLKEGDEIKDGAVPAYQVGAFTEKKVMEWKASIRRSNEVDRSEVAMKDLRTGESFVLERDVTNYESYVEAQIVPLNNTTTTIVVRAGSTLPIAETKADEVATVTAFDESKSAVQFTVGEGEYKRSYTAAPGD